MDGGLCREEALAVCRCLLGCLCSACSQREETDRVWTSESASQTRLLNSHSVAGSISPSVTDRYCCSVGEDSGQGAHLGLRGDGLERGPPGECTPAHTHRVPFLPTPCRCPCRQLPRMPAPSSRERCLPPRLLATPHGHTHSPVDCGSRPAGRCVFIPQTIRGPGETELAVMDTGQTGC